MRVDINPTSIDSHSNEHNKHEPRPNRPFGKTLVVDPVNGPRPVCNHNRHRQSATCRRIQELAVSFWHGHESIDCYHQATATCSLESDYRGEIKVLLVNLGQEAFTVEHGERIAQMVIAQHEQVQWQEVETLEETVRGAGGFGHTGVE
jgi:hypothetical protein